MSLMKRFLTTSLVLMTSIYANAESGLGCKVDSDHERAWLMMIDEGEERPPTHEDLFDAMNRDGRVFTELGKMRILNKHGHKTYYRSRPKKGVGDPACRDKTITGYECRDRQLKNGYNRSSGEHFSEPLGIKGEIWVTLPVGRKYELQSLVQLMGCSDTSYYESRPEETRSTISDPDAHISLQPLSVPAPVQ